MASGPVDAFEAARIPLDSMSSKVVKVVSLASVTMLLLSYKAYKEDYFLSKASFNSLQILEKNLPHQFAH